MTLEAYWTHVSYWYACQWNAAVEAEVQQCRMFIKTGTICTEKSLPNKHSHRLNILLLEALTHCHLPLLLAHTQRRTQWAIVSESSGIWRAETLSGDLWPLVAKSRRLTGRPHRSFQVTQRAVRGLLKDYCMLHGEVVVSLQYLLIQSDKWWATNCLELF